MNITITAVGTIAGSDPRFPDILYHDSRCGGRTGRLPRSGFCSLVANAARQTGDRQAADCWEDEALLSAADELSVDLSGVTG